MLRKIRAFELALVASLSASFWICDAFADQQSVVRIEGQSAGVEVSGFAVSSEVIVGPAGGIADQSSVTVHRGSATADATATVTQGIAIIHVTGSSETAQLAFRDVSSGTGVDVVVAEGSTTRRVSGLISAGAGGVHVIGAPQGGGVAFNGCGEVVALVAPGGAVVQVSTIAAALQGAAITPPRADAACETPADGGVGELQSKVEDLERQLAATRSESRRRQIALDIGSVRAQIASELATQAERNAALEAAAEATRTKHEQQRQLLLRIAIGVAALVLLLAGLAIWLFVRSRKLNKSLVEACKGAPSWNDCVLESASGATVKLPGAKLAKGGVVLGRSREDADVVVDKDDVSRRHARFEVLDGALHVSDLGSTNKTFVNGKDIERGLVKLQEGDKVSIGSNEFTVRILHGRG